ncbi:hypothetical protein FNJ55_14490 [Lactococcus lactis]|nr:hypothetical protein FNJ55_14490 [Lactococcus lactis]
MKFKSLIWILGGYVYAGPNGDTPSNQTVINRCPSGALKYLIKEK